MSEPNDMSEMNDWNRRIIEEFRANGGKVGGQFEGAPMILVHTRGRKSGAERVNPLVYFPDGDSLVVIGSAGGAPKHPDWYLNLAAADSTDVEVGVETFPVRVHDLRGEERDELWQRVKAAMPGFAEYEKATDRTIPLVRLTRRAA